MAPTRMTAIGIKSPGGPEMLVPEERPVPQPGKGEILVKVAAAGVNRPDVMQRMGLYPPPPGAPDIPGLEIAGEVVALGPDVKRWKVGDRVMALVIGGGYAEYCLAHESHALPVDGLSMVEAAAVPETFFTVWHNVFERGALKAGETLLVHGGSSGIGTTAIQLAKALRRARHRHRRLGGKMRRLPQARRRRRHQLQERGLRRRHQKGHQRQGRRRHPRHGRRRLYRAQLRSGRRRGPHRADRLPGRPEARQVNFMRLMLKRLHHTGSTLRARSVADKAAIARALEQNALPLIAPGKVKPVIYKTFPLKEAAAAHALMESSAHIGKIVLTLICPLRRVIFSRSGSREIGAIVGH